MTYQLAVLGGLAGLGAGCGMQGIALRGRNTDVRGSAMVAADQPKILMAGPGWLLHVNMERREPVAVYRAPKREGTVADCQAAAEGTRAAAETVDALGRVSLYVRADEVVCAAAPKGARLSWHAKPLSEPDAGREALASLD